MPGSPLMTPLDRKSPFPQPRFPAGVSGGPLALLAVELAGVAGLSANLPLAATLVLVGAVCQTLLWLGVVRPVRQLRDAMDDILERSTRETPDDNPDRARRWQIAETARILAAMRRFTGSSRSATTGRLLAMAVAPIVAGAILLGWGATAAAAILGAGLVQDPAATARQAGAAAAGRADELHAALRGGLTALERAAGPPTGQVVTAAAATVARALAAEELFRAVSIVDGSGRAIATAGHPQHPPTVSPGGSRVVQANDGGSEPIVLASTPMWDGASMLVGEFDPRALNDVVRAPGVRTRVIDPHLDTVLDTAGYLAFAKLEDPALVTVARGAQQGVHVISLPADGRAVTAQRVGGVDSPTDLGWVLVEDQSVAAAAFTADAGRRTALVVIGLVTSIGVGALAWVGVTVVRPARRLARHVERLADGEPVTPLAPQRLDEIGTAVAATNRLAAARAVRDAVAGS
ncbi:hypothetical protein GCM10009609_08130 [Pseudonocardia aurantiaca]|uniref:HAMP domain-containing protein n=1 Tax=Pseudonocardia aurantiaca TaxID=75290 RepID=A0ABW4FLG4_9PSEU